MDHPIKNIQQLNEALGKCFPGAHWETVFMGDDLREVVIYTGLCFEDDDETLAPRLMSWSDEARIEP